jgi:nucleoside phosphorylase
MAVRSYLKGIKNNEEEYLIQKQLPDFPPTFGGADILYLKTERGEVKVAIMLATEKGERGMNALLDQISSNKKPKRIIMVGMMAGIMGKVNLLDVVAPAFVSEAAIGTDRSGCVTDEPKWGPLDMALHRWLSTADRDTDDLRGITVVTHKKTVCVPAKIDNITHDIVQKLLATDRMNIVGIEMEVSALAAKQLYSWASDKNVRCLMIKGVRCETGVE